MAYATQCDVGFLAGGKLWSMCLDEMWPRCVISFQFCEACNGMIWALCWNRPKTSSTSAERPGTGQRDAESNWKASLRPAKRIQRTKKRAMQAVLSIRTASRGIRWLGDADNWETYFSNPTARKRIIGASSGKGRCWRTHFKGSSSKGQNEGHRECCWETEKALGIGLWWRQGVYLNWLADSGLLNPEGPFGLGFLF